jgi:hypothetical protein
VDKSPHKIKKGKEEYLYNTVRKYGYEDPNVLEAIEACCAPKFRDGMKEFIKIIPVDKGFDISSTAESIASQFIKEMFVRPKDLSYMIASIRANNMQVVEDIGEAYGMREEFKDELDKLIKDVTYADEQLKDAPNK